MPTRTPAASAAREHGLRVGGDGGDRLLAQDVLAGGCGLGRDRRVELLRGTDVDEVHVRSLEQPAMVRVELVRSEPGDRSGLGQPLGGRVGDRRDADPVGTLGIGGDVEPGGDVAAPDDADAGRLVHIAPFIISAVPPREGPFCDQRHALRAVGVDVRLLRRLRVRPARVTLEATLRNA